MVTAYDLFEFIYQKQTPVTVPELLRNFQKPSSQYAVFYQLSLGLERRGLVKRTKKGFQIVLSVQAQTLYKLIRFSLANNLPYNVLLTKEMALFISRAWSKKRFSARDFQLNERTFAKYVELLQRSGFLLILQRKPFLGVLFPHTFLKLLVEFVLHQKLLLWHTKGDYLEEIRTELVLFHRLVKQNENRYRELLEAYQLRFVQHSLNLEGNPITLPETMKLLQHKIVPGNLSVEAMEEVRYYQQAMHAMFRDALTQRQLTLQTILNYHFLAMQHRTEIAGKLRTVSVFIKNNPVFTVADVSEITPKLETLLQRYNEFVEQKKKSLRMIFRFASYFHNEFQHIHPFVDGNSRTVRLLTFHILLAQSIPVVDIPLGLLEEYLSSTKGSRQREDTRLNVILQQLVLYNLKLFTVNLRK